MCETFDQDCSKVNVLGLRNIFFMSRVPCTSSWVSMVMMSTNKEFMLLTLCYLIDNLEIRRIIVEPFVTQPCLQIMPGAFISKL